MRMTLKFGKGLYRKFACSKCECVFVADTAETYEGTSEGCSVRMLNCDCGQPMRWDSGKPYDFEEAANERKKRLSLSVYGMDDCSPVDVVERLIADSAFINGV